MTSHLNKGDIIIGKHRNGNESFHPIIYFEEINNDFFLGGMISHSHRRGNILLDNSHFDVQIDTDNAPSYFARSYLLKKQEWGPFDLIGRLSETGVSFVEEHLNGTTPILFPSDN
jgi:hypothetical protein